MDELDQIIADREEADKGRIQKILEANKDKNFVQRIISPLDYPDLDLGNGERGTHMMSWASVGDKNIVYPEIVMKEGKLQRLGRDEAIKHALTTKEHITFDDPREADWFGKNYKKVWGPEVWNRFQGK